MKLKKRDESGRRSKGRTKREIERGRKSVRNR